MRLGADRRLATLFLGIRHAKGKDQLRDLDISFTLVERASNILEQ